MVADQDPQQIEVNLKHHLLTHCPVYATLDIDDQHGWTSAYNLNPDHPLLKAAGQALQDTTGLEPVHVHIGATLPLTDVIKRTLGLDTIMFSFSTADEDYHAPNEFLRKSAIDEGLAAWVRILRLVPDFYDQQ